MAIPHDRPVLGKDLDTVRQQFGLLSIEACQLFGLSITRWTQIVRQGAELPVSDPSMALLVRFLDEHPDLEVLPKYPTPKEMIPIVDPSAKADPDGGKELSEVLQKEFAVLFGADASSGYRWLRTENTRLSPAVARLMYYYQMEALRSPSPVRRNELREKWRQVVADEAAVRGAPDVFRTGKWESGKFRKGITEVAATAATPDTAPAPKKGRGSEGYKQKQAAKAKEESATKGK